VFRRRAKKANQIRTRMGVFAFGIVIAYCGVALLHHGFFVYRNCYPAAMYSPALAVTGAVFMVLALIPDSLVERVVGRARH
jgi:hypothetical protein